MHLLGFIKNAIGFSKMNVSLKGIGYPKILILSSITHPQVVPNLYEFHMLNTERRYSKECW